MVKSIAKGHSFELRIAKLLQNRTGSDWRRVPMSGAAATIGHKSENMRGDVYCDGSNWCIECKIIGKTFNLEELFKDGLIRSWWKQTVDESKGLIPILIFKYHFSPVFAVSRDTSILFLLGAKRLITFAGQEEDIIYMGIIDGVAEG